MKVLGIDPGTTEAGWCLYDTAQCTPLTWGHTSWGDIRFKIRTEPDLQAVVLEKVILYSGKRGGSDFIFPVMIENIGRVIQICEDANIQYLSFNRKDICETLTGEKITRKHKISKTYMQETVQRMLKLTKKISPQHANDALCAILRAYPPCKMTKKKGSGKLLVSKSANGTMQQNKVRKPRKKAATP